MSEHVTSVHQSNEWKPCISKLKFRTKIRLPGSGSMEQRRPFLPSMGGTWKKFLHFSLSSSVPVMCGSNLSVLHRSVGRRFWGVRLLTSAGCGRAACRHLVGGINFDSGLMKIDSGRAKIDAAQSFVYGFHSNAHQSITVWTLYQKCFGSKSIGWKL